MEANRTNIPTATNWLLTSVGSEEQPMIRSTYMVVSNKTSKKGTAFSLTTGFLITNEHVVRGSAAHDLVIISSTGQQLAVKDIVVDADLDLAALELTEQPTEGFRIQRALPAIGERVHTWGYPLAYNGPSPILSVGYLAGFNPVQSSNSVVKHYVVNGAFNPGNSGGPVIAEIEDAVVGVVVSKHAPIPKLHLSALEALKKQSSGFLYPVTDEAGNVYEFSEGQIIGVLLQYFRDITQLVIGEAIAADVLINFLDDNDLSWVEA
ncbi:MAG: serine protease [Candidatus Bipolaricaulia bacterium]